MDQMFLIRTAKEMGLRVLAVDMNPDSVGFELADDTAIISNRDVPAIIKYLDQYHKNGNKVSGVITMGSDIPEVISRLSEHLKTPHISLETAKLSTDKYLMKQAFQSKGIPIPWFQEIDSFLDLKEVIAQRGLPLVIKPVDRSGSRGVFFLQNESNVESLFLKSKEFSYSERVMVEEYLPGDQISTETIMYQGKGLSPGFSDRNYAGMERFHPQIIENGGWTPSCLNQSQRQAVEDLVEQTSLALGVTNGVTKGDVVLTPEGPKIIEMAARLSGGDFCESLVPLSIGVNYVKTCIEIAIGEKPHLEELKPKFQRACANRYFFPESGRLVRIEGVEEVQKQPWLKKLEFWYEPGESVPEMLSHAHRFGVFVVEGQDREEVAKRVNWVYEKINIIIGSN